MSWDLRNVQRIAGLKDTARAKGAEWVVWPYTGFNGIIGSTWNLIRKVLCHIERNLMFTLFSKRMVVSPSKATRI